MPAKVTGSQRVADERVMPAVRIDRSRGLAGLLDIARRSGAPIGAYLLAADRNAALDSLKYRSRKGP
jgi:hypothetical protein